MSRRTTIVPRVKAAAWHGDPSESPPLFEVADVEDALRSAYDGEALITCYAPPEADRFPRLGKAAQAYYVASDDDEEPTIGVVPVDIDYADHAEPPDGWHEDVLERVEWPCGWYRTPHGLRLVFYPKRPVDLDVANGYLAWLHEQLEEWGIETDQATRKWYRLFAAPHAFRRDLPYDYSDLEPIDEHPDDLSTDSPSLAGPIVDRDRPDDTKNLTKTYLKPIADRKLKDDVYEARLSAPTGERHATFLRAAAKIVSDYDTEDPVVPYEILYPSWEKLDGKDDAELWRICKWSCAQHSGQAEAEEAARQDAYERAAEAMGVHRSQVRERVIIDTGKAQYIWDEEEESYSRPYTHKHQLLGALQRHAPNLASWALEERPGDADLFRIYSSVPDRLVYSYGEDDTFDPEDGVFRQRVCEIDDRLDPVRHEDVARWIEAIAGDREDEVKRWLCAFPKLDRPLCGLYIQGPASIGKQMLALGLARLYSSESAVTPYGDVVGEWNQSLKQSPLIWADEKVPQDAFRENDSSVLRRTIGNDSVRITEKNMNSRTLEGYARVLITANNDDALAIREELDQDDIEAIRIRIGYVHADESAADVLRQIADEQGFETTREATESWVKGGKIAEYVLWLYQNYDLRPDNRLLVEGWESELTEDLPTRVGSAGEIATTVALAVVSDRDFKSIRAFDDHIYVNSNLLAAEWVDIVGHIQDSVPSQTARTKSLKNLADGSSKFRVGETSRRSFWKIPAKTIGRIAQRRGVCDSSHIERASSGSRDEKKTGLEAALG